MFGYISLSIRNIFSIIIVMTAKHYFNIRSGMKIIANLYHPITLDYHTVKTNVMTYIHNSRCGYIWEYPLTPMEPYERSIRLVMKV